MHFILSTIAALAALLPVCSGHAYISRPKMFADHKQAEGYVNAPLDPSGNDFPCQNGTPDEVVPPENVLQYGSNILQVVGTAVHGGGSAQMVITYDFPPPRDEKKWRVLTSYEGKHPIDVPGNLPGNAPPLPQHKYTVWDFLPPGKATIAWSWFNHIGNREHYMKCATVSIGGSTKILNGAMESDALKKLPTMFRANSNQCVISPAQANSLHFKNPGNDVQGSGDQDTTCDTTLPGSSGSNSPSKEPTPTRTPDSEGAHPSENAPAPPAKTSTSAPAPSAPAPTKPAPPAYTKPVETPAPSQPETPQPSGSCKEGEVVCNADGTWSLCGSGTLHNMGGTGGGRICKNGELVLDPAWATWSTKSDPGYKRSIRFSDEHRRRRH